MKKIGFICVYEDEDYLEQCILSCKDDLDALIIIEGAFQCTLYTNGVRNNKTERSSDRTIEIINKYVDNKRVFVKFANEKEHKDQYQLGLEFAKERGADWAVLIDSDEIWTKEAWKLLNLKLKLAKNLGVYEYRVRQYCFINDFQNYFLGEYPRVFKVTPDAKFLFDNEVAWPDHNKVQDCGKVNSYIHLLSPVPLNYHYSYVRSQKRWKLKQDSVYEKDKNPINHQYKLIGDKYIIPSDIGIYQFIGKHPDIMKNHSYANKTAYEIIYNDKNL